MKNKDNHYISIIIPCYNVSKYIDNCINMLMHQTYKYFEIILVDDCSTDDTLSKLKKYENKDNITIIKNETNKGAGYSRNVALTKAKYDIISFIDADDYIDENYYFEMIKSMQKNESDISICDIYLKYDEGREESSERAIAFIGTPNYIGFINNPLAASPCNKLFKKQLLLDNPFAEGIMNEDIPAVIGCIIDAENISYVDSVYYTYYQRSGSVQNSHFSIKRFDIFTAVEILDNRKQNNEKYDKIKEYIYFHQLFSIVILIIREKNIFDRAKYLKIYNKKIKKYNIMQNPSVWTFIDDLYLKAKLLYKVVLKLSRMHLHFIASLMISIYNLYGHIKKPKTVIKEKIDLKTLKKAAIKNQKFDDYGIKISVTIPNYNYEQFLYQRIYSILTQKVKIYELIILDDCSKDNSRKLIDEIVSELQNYLNIKKDYNTINSGTAFKQWHKSFKLAKGDYIWIAEADDYCDSNFLKSVVKPIVNDKNVILSYSDTAFIDKKGIIINKTVKPMIDIMETNHWNNDYVNSGIDELKNYDFLNCTIANVSSVLFKNNNYDEYFKLSNEYKQAGDWLFYINVMKDGNISYIDKTYNYYRVHGNNVTSMTKKQLHYNEIKRIHSYVQTIIDLADKDKEEIKKRYDFLKRVWNVKDDD